MEKNWNGQIVQITNLYIATFLNKIWLPKYALISKVVKRIDLKTII